MRSCSAVIAVLGCFALAVSPLKGDDLKINTPVVSSSLQGRWELQPEKMGNFKQSLLLGRQFTGHWQQSSETLPVTIAWFVEGGELRILHYYDPKGDTNYRVKTLMVPYKLSKETLKLTFDGKTTTWNRVEELEPAKP
ncbi:MAG: hypothetical protein V4719_31250 [Planctomycetota bacterium]